MRACAQAQTHSLTYDTQTSNGRTLNMCGKVFMSASVRNVAVTANTFSYLGTSGVAVQVCPHSNCYWPYSLTLIHGSQQLQYFLSYVVMNQRKRFPPVCPLFHRGEHDDKRCRGGRLTPPPLPSRAFQGKTGTAMMDGRDGELMMEKHGPAMDNGVRLPRNNTISHNVFGNYGVSHARNHFLCL
jgi:hypothetical protein